MIPSTTLSALIHSKNGNKPPRPVKLSDSVVGTYVTTEITYRVVWSLREWKERQLEK